MVCEHTIEKQTKSLTMLFPQGRVWERLNDSESNFYKFAKSIAEQIVDFKDFICSLFDEFFCETSNNLRDKWLVEYGLPNACDPRGETLCILANGFQQGTTLEEIIQDALQRLGITATIIDESQNGEPLVYSILVNENSEIFQDCFYVAGSTDNRERVCGQPYTAFNIANIDNDCDDDALVVNVQSIVAETCGFNANTNEGCETGLIASKNFIDIIPNLTCLFEQIIPLGFKVNFYLNDKEIPIEGI